VLGGRGFKTYEDGRSGLDGETWNGTHQEIIEYPGYLEGCLLGTREGIRLAISYAQFECS
jgi:hypothetical protein